jgi:glycosyltransferase involved in cell wall biosynthesis
MPPRIAIVHEWFDIYRGSERVVEQLIQLFPHADFFSLVDFLPADQRGLLQGKLVQTSFLQHLPFARGHFRSFLPLMPLAIEQFDLSGYDLVLSSSHAVAKGVLTGPDQLHISYIHSPIRYAWDMQAEYLRENHLTKGVKGRLAQLFLHYIRLWDAQSIDRVDRVIANSNFIARRIQKVYRRDATVIYPPVDVERFQLREKKEDFYLAASRLTPYKKIDRIIQAFSGFPGHKLVVIGDGSELSELRKMASPNVEVLGYQTDDVLRDYLSRAKAFIFAAQEDFGILPVEAQACGTPVIAYGRGGAVETIRGLDTVEPTGLFFQEQTPEAICEAVRHFEQEQSRIIPLACRKNASRFSPERFCSEYTALVSEAWETFSEMQKHGKPVPPLRNS